MSRPTEFVCEHCGYQGSDAGPGNASGNESVDEIQCPMCGEPVTPLR